VADRLVSWNMVDRASELLEKCLEESPGHPGLLRRLGRIRLAQGRTGEAIPLLEQAVAHDRLMAPMRSAAQDDAALTPQPPAADGADPPGI